MDHIDNKDITYIKEWLGAGSINIFGLPFAGKDTHGTELATLFGANLLGGGDILRNSVVPQHVREIFDAGLLAPIDEYLKIVLPYLSREEFKGRPLILSSVGRWHGEEEGVLRATTESGHPTKAVIFLHLDPAIARERWASSRAKGDRGERADDAEHLLDVRFDEFMNKTMPVIETYRDMGLLIEVDSNPPVETVSELILRGLLEHAQRDR